MTRRAHFEDALDFCRDRFPESMATSRMSTPFCWFARRGPDDRERAIELMSMPTPSATGVSHDRMGPLTRGDGLEQGRRVWSYPMRELHVSIEERPFDDTVADIDLRRSR